MLCLSRCFCHKRHRPPIPIHKIGLLMFMVGDILWLEGEEYICDVPDLQNFSGCILCPLEGSARWYENGCYQSFQDPAAPEGEGEWMPAVVWSDGTKLWCDKDALHSFLSPITGKRMPAHIDYNDKKYWFDRGREVHNPKDYKWDR